MKEHHIKIEKTARYYTIGEPSSLVKHLWFCLHGYGQLGQYFAQNFKPLKSDDRLIVIPEAPNRFYLNGTGGRIGATWMTKEERLRDIDDYCQYLNQLIKSVESQLSKNVNIHLFGFSQGLATAFRWANVFDGSNLKSLHGWAGTFPPDIDYRLNAEKFNGLNITLHFASDDRFISEEKSSEIMSQLNEMDIEIKRFDFEGEHKIYEEPLIKLFNTIEAKN
ncbi:MAG: alpha/beta hydrolase [Schleiferiaceae bacterium]|nr:alpha/beta hydrolase [Schleiferiaceae bacterium]